MQYKYCRPRKNSSLPTATGEASNFSSSWFVASVSSLSDCFSTTVAPFRPVRYTRPLAPSAEAYTPFKSSIRSAPGRDDQRRGPGGAFIARFFPSRFAILLVQRSNERAVLVVPVHDQRVLVKRRRTAFAKGHRYPHLAQVLAPFLFAFHIIAI